MSLNSTVKMWSIDENKMKKKNKSDNEAALKDSNTYGLTKEKFKIFLLSQVNFSNIKTANAL